MRKILLTLLGCLVAFSAVAEEDIFERKAAQIYDMCDASLSQVYKKEVLLGNIADVNREQQLRQCLKNETIKIATTIIRKEKIESFNKALDGLESNAFSIYQAILFCGKNSNDEWCNQYYKDDTSLDKLMLEKSITSQVMKVLTDLLEIKAGGF